MALPPAQFEPKNDQLAIPPDGGAPPSVDNGPLDQDLASVHESSRLINGHLEVKTKDGNVHSNSQGLSPASPEQEPALGLSDLEARNEAISVGATPAGTSPPDMNGLSGQGSAPINSSAGLINGRSDMESKDGNVPSNVQGLSAASPEQEPDLGLSDLKATNGGSAVGGPPQRTSPLVSNDPLEQVYAPINSSAGLTNGGSDVEAKGVKIASNVQDHSTASSEQGPVHGHSNSKDKTGATSVGDAPPGTSPSVMNGVLEQSSAPVDGSSGSLNASPNLMSKSGNTSIANQAASPESSPPISNASSETSERSLTAYPNPKSKTGNTHITNQAASSETAPPISNASSESSEKSLDAHKNLKPSGNTTVTIQAASPVSPPPITNPPTASATPERSLDAHKNLKPSGNTTTTFQAASPVSLPPITNSSTASATPERSLNAHPNLMSKSGNTPITNQAASPRARSSAARASDGQPELEAEGQDFPGNVEPAPLGSSPPLANSSSEQSSTPLGASSDGNSTSKAEKGDSSPTNTAAQGTPPAVANGTPDQVSASSSHRNANRSGDQSKQQEGTSTQSGRRNGGQNRGRAPEKEETRRFTGDILSVEDFHNSLIGLHPGSDPFMKIFIDHEKSHLENPNTFQIHLLENGERFREAVGNFKNVYLINVKDKLGMEAPEDLSFDTILVYIPPKTELGINYSNSTAQDPLDTTVIEEYLKHFNIPVEHRDFIRNSITLEFSKLPLGEKFTEPSFARENSMVHELEDALEKEKEKTKEELKKVQEELEKTQKKSGNRRELKKNIETIEKKLKKLDGMIGSMPRYTKYLIMSQEGSFTDVHFDFSGTSVYYHVFKGQKIFYIAPPTPENLKIYMDHKEKGGTEWVGTTLKDQWRRVVINEGQTAWIPGGYLHCVYTPVDSLVIGGNFLMKKYAKLQFECTEHEEGILPKRGRKKNINTSHLFEEFRPVMWGYTEYCLLPRLREAKDEESVELGEVFVKHCNPEARCLEKKKENKWYTKPEKRALHLELKQVMGMADADQPSTSAAEAVDAPGTSQASSSVGANSRSRKRGPGKKTMKKDEEEETVGESEAKVVRKLKEKPTNSDGEEEDEIPGTSEEPSTSAAWDCKRSQKRRGKKQTFESGGEDMEADLSYSEGMVDADQPSTSASWNPRRRGPTKKKPEIMDEAEVTEALGTSQTSSSVAANPRSRKRGAGKKAIKKDEEDVVGESESSQSAARGKSSSTNLQSTASNSSLKREPAASRRSANPSSSAVSNRGRERIQELESMDLKEEGNPSEEPSSSSLSAPAPISRRKAAPKRPKQGSSMFAAVPEYDAPIDQLLPDPQADGEVRKIEEVKESQPRSGKALDPEKKQSGAVEEDMEAVEEDEEEVLRKEDAAQAESSFTNLPSTSSASRSVKRKPAASRRSAKPSTSAAPNQTKKRKEKEESMNQEGEGTPSQEDSSHPAPAPISRRRRNPPHSSTSAGAPKRQKQGAPMNVADPEHDDPIEQLSPNSQAAAEGRKSRGTKGSQSHSVKASDPEEKKPGSVEKPMEAVKKDKEEVLRNEEEVLENEEEMLRKRVEVNQPGCSSNVPYHTGDDDYDGGSRGGETVDFDSQEHSMDVDREEKDEVLGGEKEETSKESTQPASSSIIPCNNTTSAPDRLATSQEDKSEVVVVPTTTEGKPTDKKDQQTSVVSDSKNKESIPVGEPSGVDEAGKNEVLGGEKKSTPKGNDTLPADSACTPADNGNTVSASAVNRPISQEDVLAASETPATEKGQLSSPDSNLKEKDSEPAPESVGDVRSCHEPVSENQVASRSEHPSSKETPSVTSLKRTINPQIKKEGEVPVKRARADALKLNRLTPPRTRSPPPATTVGTYLQDLLSFLGKLHHQNPNLKEFIEIMGDLVRGCTMWKKKMSYLDIKCSMRRVFNSFKNNFFLVEINTEEMKVVKDEVNFELKTFLSSFKNFISTYETIPEGFGQLLTDIGDEIRDCEELEKGGEQKMLVIEEIIEKFSPDFDQFGLNRKYLAEIERRRALEGAGSSEAR